MKGTAYLAMGGVSMGIAGSIVDHDLFQDYFGMRVEEIDMTEFVRRMDREIYDRAEFERALAWVRENCPEGRDPNAPEKQRTREQKDEDWARSVKMALIARDLMVGNPKLAELGFPEEARGHNAVAGGFQGQRQWTDHFPNGDFLEAILNTSWDWNGIRQPYMVATENDSLNGASMLFGHLLTGGTAQLFADVRTFWSPEAVRRVTGHRLSGLADDGILHLINSGPAALDWTGEQRGSDGKPACQAVWRNHPGRGERLPASHPLVRIRPGLLSPAAAGPRTSPRAATWPVTMFRLNLVKGLGPVLQIAEGHTITLPDNVHQTLDERTNPTWPTTWFAPTLTGNGPFASVYDVMNHWGANHGAISFGHIGGDLITLASLLRIPVDMHNVPAERVFRPSAWARFGSLEPQTADYKACQTYGPLYR
jgi:L-fucose isomerase